jgi:hypothetical protein
VIDVVYLVRDGDRNDELRYSLRSLSNLPHRTVWLAGFQPSWINNVGRIKVGQRRGDKWRNQARNLKAACNHPDVADRFVLFNDDFFVMEPIHDVPVFHRGPLSRLVEARYRHRRYEYSTRMVDTHKALGDGALCYDAIHTPLPVRKYAMGAVLDDIGDRLLFRTVYGNRDKLGGSEHPDVKWKRGSEMPDGPFVSTSDRVFESREPGKTIRSMFRTPCSYER